MTTQWFIRIGRKQHGPFAPRQLKRLADAGKVLPSTEVRPGTEGNWVLAQRVKWLFSSPKQTDAARRLSEDDILDILAEPPAASPKPELDGGVVRQTGVPSGISEDEILDILGPAPAGSPKTEREGLARAQSGARPQALSIDDLPRGVLQAAERRRRWATLAAGGGALTLIVGLVALSLFLWPTVPAGDVSQNRDAAETVAVRGVEITVDRENATALTCAEELREQLEVSGNATRSVRSPHYLGDSGEVVWDVMLTLDNRSSLLLKPVRYAALFETDDEGSFPSVAILLGQREKAPLAVHSFTASENTADEPYKILGAAQRHQMRRSFRYDMQMGLCLKADKVSHLVVAFPEYEVQHAGVACPIRVLVVFQGFGREEWRVSRTLVLPVCEEVLEQLVADSQEPYPVRAFAGLWLMDLNPVKAFNTVARHAAGLHVDRQSFGSDVLVGPFRRLASAEVTKAATELASRNDIDQGAYRFCMEYLKMANRKDH
jgi:hypothetical protein